MKRLLPLLLLLLTCTAYAGSLTMTTPFTARSASVSISTINSGSAPDDWAIWTTGSLTPTDRLNGGGSTITAVFMGSNTFSSATEPQSVTWTGGTPTASGTNTTDVFNSNFATGNGITLTFPADTNTRTVWILGGPYNTSQDTIDVSLSDSSATAIHDTTHLIGGTSGFNPITIVIVYAANSASQTLTVSMYTQATSPQTVTLQAAAVAKTGGGGGKVASQFFALAPMRKAPRPRVAAPMPVLDRRWYPYHARMAA